MTAAPSRPPAVPRVPYRQMHEAYKAHLEACWAVGVGLWCCACRALLVAADIESYANVEAKAARMAGVGS